MMGNQTVTRLALNTRYAFRFRKPLLTLRLCSAVAKTILLKRPPLRYVDFAIGFTCNLSCEHCFATSLRQPGRRKMTTADYRRVAGECMRLGTVNFSFQGGEPLLDERLEQIIRSCRPDRNVISVSTNGTLLDPVRVAHLRRIGVDILTVSLDSADPAEHDRFRGRRGTHAKTMEGIRTALNHGLRVTLGTVVTHQNLLSPGITNLLRHARRNGLLLYLIFPVPAGRWSGQYDMLLTSEDLAYIERLTRESPWIRTDLQANLGPKGCGAVKEILYITPYGDVLPCPFMHISAGNALETPLAHIRRRALESPYFQGYHPSCLVSTYRPFIDRHLSRTFHVSHLPLSWWEAFDGEPLA